MNRFRDWQAGGMQDNDLREREPGKWWAARGASGDALCRHAWTGVTWIVQMLHGAGHVHRVMSSKQPDMCFTHTSRRHPCITVVI